ncbi:hypothetical protein B0H19DRAFT_1177230 [Mycena capillaripes]|nr:hypothetical protein B0H19DRAFT_1177230 [Mycena capillaripes]
MTPARRLPRDIIQKIFIACLSPDRNPVIVSTEVPILFGHICSGWKLIARSTPWLWSKLHTYHRAGNYRKSQTNFPKSSNYDLVALVGCHFRFVLSRTFNATISATEIFSALSIFSRRWKSIQFLFALASNSLQELLIPTEDAPNVLLDKGPHQGGSSTNPGSP